MEAVCRASVSKFGSHTTPVEVAALIIKKRKIEKRKKEKRKEEKKREKREEKERKKTHKSKGCTPLHKYHTNTNLLCILNRFLIHKFRI